MAFFNCDQISEQVLGKASVGQWVQWVQWAVWWGVLLAL